MASSKNDALKTVVVVGGGLSGLVTARELLRAFHDHNMPVKILVLEARDRFGGRIYKEHGVDLGASWTWPGHDKHVTKLATEMGIELEEQYVAGHAMAQESNGSVVPYARDESPAGPGSMRLKGGPSALIAALVADLNRNENVELKTNLAVDSISACSDGIEWCDVVAYNPSLKSEVTAIGAAAVVVALPLQLAATSIRFSPPLPEDQVLLMRKTPTWMANTGKVGFIYDTRFWAEQGKSGTAFSEVGPLSQIWDASTATEATFSLGSFVFDEALTSLSDPEQALSSDSLIMNQLIKIFGPLAARPSRIVYKAWDRDVFTAPPPGTCPQSGRSVPYGYPAACRAHNNIVFAGAETCPNENGHMNGAIGSGLRAAMEVLSLVAKKL